MTCKDCVHYEACKSQLPKSHWYGDYADDCKHFKDKSRFLNIGDKIYQHDSERIYESTIKNIIYETTGITFDERAISKTVFKPSRSRKSVEREEIKNANN